MSDGVVTFSTKKTLRERVSALLKRFKTAFKNNKKFKLVVVGVIVLLAVILAAAAWRFYSSRGSVTEESGDLATEIADYYQQRLPESVENFKQVDTSQLTPDERYNLYVVLGTKQNDLKDYQGALESYRQAISVRADYPPLLEAAGDAASKLNDQTAAQQYYQQARALYAKQSTPEAKEAIKVLDNKLKGNP